MGLLRELSKESVYSLYKKYQLTKLKRKGLKIIENYLATTTERKLHIGAGGSFLKGWLNVDLEPLEDQIAYFDAAADYPLPDNSIDFVFTEHLFEHLSAGQQAKMLSEVKRVLKPGGVIRLATPNLDAILSIRGNKSELVKEYLDWSAKVFYPKQLERYGESAKNEVFLINNYFYSWGHQYIHNPETMRLLLETEGFSGISQKKIFESDIELFRNRETHGNVIPPQFNEFETMIFEATKG